MIIIRINQTTLRVRAQRPAVTRVNRENRLRKLDRRLKHQTTLQTKNLPLMLANREIRMLVDQRHRVK